MQFNFIAVNYNGAQLTRGLLESIRTLHRSDGDSVHTIVVDNNSDAGDLAELASYIREDEGEILLPLDRNAGYFAGLNAGLAILDDKESAFTIVGNNDLVYQDDFLIQLGEYKPRENVMVLAPDVVTLDGRHQNPLVRKRLPAWHKVRADLYFANYYITQCVRGMGGIASRLSPRRSSRKQELPFEAEEIKLGIGACYVLVPAYFEACKKLDDRVFLWGEEVLLSNQVETAGGSILFYPGLKVTHCESASVRHIQSRSRFEILKASYKVYREYL